MDYLSLIISFIIGGGLSTLLNLKLSKQASKVDFADKAMVFMEKQNDNLMKRVTSLEIEVKQILKFKCERVNCTIRIPLA